MERPQPTFEDYNETIWVVSQSTYGILGASTDESEAHRIPEINMDPSQLPVHVQGIKLHRPSLRPIYGGGTLIENLWAEMDAIMERLMTGQEAEDGGDRFRAEELAWVLAIVTNAYDPDINRIRKETVERWNASQQEADQDEMMTRPEGADQ